MRNLRTHMWLCFTLGVFLLMSLILSYFTVDISQAAGVLTPKFIRIGIIDMGVYMIYLLIVLFMAIKYTPSKA